MVQLPRIQFRVLFIRIEQTPGHKMLLLCLYTTMEIIEKQAFSGIFRGKKRQKNNNNYLIKLGNITTNGIRHPYVVPWYIFALIICRRMLFLKNMQKRAQKLKNQLTGRHRCVILFRRDEIRSFFCAVNQLTKRYEFNIREVKLCVPG